MQSIIILAIPSCMFVYARRTGLIIQYATRGRFSGKNHHEARLISLRQEANDRSARCPQKTVSSRERHDH